MKPVRETPRILHPAGWPQPRGYTHGMAARGTLVFVAGLAVKIAQYARTVDMLARHPGTARYIARKLCRRLISDHPPEPVVQAAADTFMANLDAADQLKQVERQIISTALRGLRARAEELAES